MRGQIECAAREMREYFDAQLPPGGHTVGGWRVGEPHLTGNTNPNISDPQEGLWVTPATMATAMLYTFTPYRGSEWGGVAGGNALLVRTLRQKLKLFALMPYFTDHELYDEQGNVTFRFLTPNPKRGEYTFTWSYDLPYLYNTWTWFDGWTAGIIGYLPGQSTYSVKVNWTSFLTTTASAIQIQVILDPAV